MGESFNRKLFLKIAIDAYSNKYNYNEDDFKKDIFRFFIIRKMIRRFLNSGLISEKLILNNIIVCLNIFGINAVNVILKMMCSDKEFEIVKSCLLFLNCFNLINDSTKSNQIITDILNDIKHRYTISPNL